MPRLVALLVAVLIVMLGVMTCLPLLREKAVQNRARLQLEEELRLEMAKTRELEVQIARVKSDTTVVEKLAREKFGLGRTGEVIFKFRPDLPGTPTNGVAGGPTVPKSGR